MSPSFQIRMRNGKLFFLFFDPKKYVLGAQKNRLKETVLLSTQNACFNWWVMNIIISRKTTILCQDLCAVTVLIRMVFYV